MYLLYASTQIYVLSMNQIFGFAVELEVEAQSSTERTRLGGAWAGALPRL